MSTPATTTEAVNLRPTWAEVSLARLRQNFRTLQDYVAPQATVCAVVKAHAYGHGAVDCARALEQEGAKWFGVTSTDEGLALRDGGITARVLLMTGFWRGDEGIVLERDLTPAVWHWEHIDRLEDAAERLHRSSVPVHLKVDTGMARLGASLNHLPMLLDILKSARHVKLEGIFTHLASAEVIDAPDAQAQSARFEEVLATLARSGFSPPCVHMANSAAIATRPKTWKNMVRPGLALYGYQLPLTSAMRVEPAGSHQLPLKPVLSWKTRIFSLRDVEAGQAIGYNGAYVTPGPARIAALPVGYADGLNRHLSSRGRVIVRDEYAPIVGNISMDITLVDVTSIPAADIGDEVIILGESEHRSLTAVEHATLASTIPYEILCNISKRVPRKYIA